jgi:hypothetical protein
MQNICSLLPDTIQVRPRSRQHLRQLLKLHIGYAEAAHDIVMVQYLHGLLDMLK